MRLCAVLALLAACSEQADEPAGAAVLQGETLAEGAFLAAPGRLMVHGSQLVVLDRWAPMIHVLSRADGRRITSFGREGSGPGEFKHPQDVQPDPRDPSALWVYDLAQTRLTQLRFAPGDTVPATGAVVSLSGVAPALFQPRWLTDTSVVSTGLYPRGRLVVANTAGALVATVGDVPSHPGAESTPVTVLQHAYTGPLTVSPDRSRMALGTRQADRLEIYGADGKKLHTVQGSTGFLPVFETAHLREGVAMTTGEELRFGFIDLASTERFIFALFSGDRRGDMPGRANFGKEVQVYDWEGNRVTTLGLPERALSITVDPDARALYAIQHEPEPRIVRYALPDLSRRR